MYYDGLVFSATLDFLNNFNHCQQAGTTAGCFVGIPTMIVELSRLMAVISLHRIVDMYIYTYLHDYIHT